MSEPQKSFEADGTRPIENTDLEIADTFNEDGKRPIAESPDFLTQNQDMASENSSSEEPAENSALSSVDSVESETDTLNVDGERPIDNSDVKVVDSFEADGERPIMANKYEVVDTIDIDGERPITSESNIGKK